MFQGFSKPLDIANKTSCTRVVTKAAIALPSISLVSIFPCSEICAIQQELAFQSKILVPCCSLSNSSCSIDVLPCFIWESGNHRFSPIPRLKSAQHVLLHMASTAMIVVSALCCVLQCGHNWTSYLCLRCATYMYIVSIYGNICMCVCCMEKN